MSVYKIVCPDKYFYIGSTSKHLQVRLYQHHIDSTRKNTKFYNHINQTGGWTGVNIECLETTDDYKIKELDLIFAEKDNPYCLNMKGTVGKDKAYQNRLERVSKWYYNNRDYVLEKRKNYYKNKKDNAVVV